MFSKVDFKWLYKSNTISTQASWRQIIQVPKFELCSVLLAGSKIPPVQNFIQHLLTIFPTLPTKCPKKVPVHFESYNFTWDDAGANTGELRYSLQETFSVSIPNGMYRSIIQISADDDSNVLRVEWMTEVRSRLNADNFWKFYR